MATVPITVRAGLLLSDDNGLSVAVDGETSKDAVSALYRRFGLAFAEQIRGSYAIAIWDPGERQLVLARDILGIRPLFYTESPSGVVFASDVTSLHDLVARRPQICVPRIAGYLMYLYAGSPNTMFVAMRQVSPGETIVFKDGAIERRDRWASPAFANAAINASNPSAEVSALLDDAIASAVSGDAQPVFLLSSGVDGATLVERAARLGGTVRTLTVGFENCAKFDERPRAAAFARQVGTLHEEIVIGPECIDALARVTRILGAPAGSPATIMADAMFRQIGGGRVVCGDGGNEVFGGVPKFFQLMAALGKSDGAVGSGRSMLNLAQRLWHQVHARGGERVFYNAARLYFKIVGPRGTRASKLATPAEFERALELYASLEAIWSPSLIRAITGPSSPVHQFADSGVEWFRSFAPTSERSDIVQRLIAMRLRTTIAHNTVPYVERTATAAGVDTRFPFLDDRLVAYLTTLPVEENYARGYRDLMRRSVSCGIPRSSFATLRGFLPPMEMWLRTSRWREVVEDLLSPRTVAGRGWFAPSAVADLLRRFYTGDVSMPTERAERRQSLALSLWTLCALETFCREFP